MVTTFAARTRHRWHRGMGYYLWLIDGPAAGMIIFCIAALLKKKLGGTAFSGEVYNKFWGISLAVGFAVGLTALIIAAVKNTKMKKKGMDEELKKREKITDIVTLVLSIVLCGIVCFLLNCLEA